MNTTTKTKTNWELAQEYRATLPLTPNKRGTQWTKETFSKWFSIAYPNACFDQDQEWNGITSRSNGSLVRHKYIFICKEHGPFERRVGDTLRESKGCGCKGCIQQKKERVGVKRKKATPEEKADALKYFQKCGNLELTAKVFGRNAATLETWFSSKRADDQKKRSRDYYQENKERHKFNSMQYSKTDNGIAIKKRQEYKRRLLKQNISWEVFVDGRMQEIDLEQTLEVFGDVLLPKDEIQAIAAIYKECQRITEETGIPHHVDHIQPLTKGGEHLAINLQIITGKENVLKSNNFRDEDKVLLAKRLFEVK